MKTGMIAAVSVAILFILGQGSSPASQPASARGRVARVDPAAAESVRKAVIEMIKQGLIKRFDLKTGKFYINGPLWEGFEIDAKEQIVKVISKHRDFSEGRPQVTLYESRSGKELANYGPFAGVTIR